VPDWDDTDYERLASDYASVRRPDPAVAEQLKTWLGGARTVINVGAGTGAYEPQDRYVVAVEPSEQMRRRRPRDLPPAIDARADALPFDADVFDAGLAVLTLHHWPDLESGLGELRRVTRGPIVVVTADPGLLGRLWLATYAPEFHAVERRRYPPITRIRTALGGRVSTRPLRIPLHCTDGFVDAFYGRPEALLNPRVRRAQSAWSFVSEAAQGALVARLSADLASGVWDARFGYLRSQPYFEGSLQILVAVPSSGPGRPHP
jgi:SAM-dependent methyltransferase